MDDTSNKPGEQVFEKLISGRHLAILLAQHPAAAAIASASALPLIHLARQPPPHSLLLFPSLLPPHIPPQQYLYTLHHGLRPAHHWPFLLFVEPSNSKPTPGKYTIRLLLKIDDVERLICECVSLQLSVDLQKLNFVVL
ncbi:hypothetical protein B0H14DRAFT_3476839 [Mycena olivaceomarginata]|nr:hypothetical protein B0H14DRAFT_3476839 [Mycena olivaceomarginata]